MPDTPEREIEKQLRASAEQRRAEAGEPFELHPATRRVLQGEVARHHGVKPGEAPASRSWWSMFWSRLAAGASLVAILGVCVWSFWTPEVKRAANEQRFAAANGPQPASEAAAPRELKKMVSDESLTVAADAPRAEPAPVMSPAAPASGSRSYAAEDLADKTKQAAPPESRQAARSTFKLPPESLVLVERSKPEKPATALKSEADADAMAAPQVARRATDAERLTLADNKSAEGALAETATTPSPARNRDGTAPRPVQPTGAAEARLDQVETMAPATSAPSLALSKDAAAAPSLGSSGGARRGGAAGGRGGGGGAGFGGGAAQSQTRANFYRLKSNEVLNAFRLEQQGDNLRVIDADGSTYTGRLNQASPAAVSGSLSSTAAAPVPQSRAQTPAAASAPPEARTVNFSVSGTNLSLAQRVVFTGQWQQVGTAWNFENIDARSPAVAAKNFTEPAQNQSTQSTINGQAVVGEKQFFRVQAVPTQR